MSTSTAVVQSGIRITPLIRPQPRIPKKRSRGGCSYCKEKKKKCDEATPLCGRCKEHGKLCVYEPVRPRQRRKHNPVNDVNYNRYSTPRGNQISQLPEGWNTMWHIPASETPTNGVYESGALQLLAGTMCNDGSFILHSNIGAHDLSTDTTDTSASSEEEVEEVVHHESAIFNPSCRSPSLALITPVPTVSPRLEFYAPSFVEFSERPNRRALIDHFAHVLSHLIVLREDEGNPFQQLVLPLSHKSKAVENAIYALSCAHLERRGIKNEEKSEFFHSLAIRGLSKLIGIVGKGGYANKNELLATVILLVYYEVLVQQGRSNTVGMHLKGAMDIMMNFGEALTDPTSVFLERAFRFYDVITALSFGTAPVYKYNGGFAPLPPIDCRGATVAAGNADALLGMATSLWPIIHRLSTLAGLKKELSYAEMQGNISKANSLRNDITATAFHVELALQEWKLDASSEEVLQNETGNLSKEKAAARKQLQSILNSAMAYRHSGIVYLYRTIYAYSRGHDVVQRHTHISLTHCVGTVEHGGPMGALLWPLFVAACEAINQSDRDLAKEAFEAVLRRQGMTNIHRAWLIVQEVWKRVDNGEDTAEESMLIGDQKADLWRRVSDDLNVNVVFG